MKSNLKQIAWIALLTILLIPHLHSFGEASTRNQPDAAGDSGQGMERSTKDAMIYYNKGNAYCNLGHYEQAIADYNKAIELDPNLAMAYNNRGATYKKFGNYNQSITDFDKAIELNPQYAEAYNNRGVTYDSFGDYKQSIADFDKAIALNPQYAEAYNNRGFAYNNLGNHRQAIADYNKAIELAPSLAMAYHNRGTAYDSLGNHQQAIADYNKAIELNRQDEANAQSQEAAVTDDRLGKLKTPAADPNKVPEQNLQDRTDFDGSNNPWMESFGKVIQENKLRGLWVAIAMLAAGLVLFTVKSRKNSFADMQDSEMIALIKEAAREEQFNRISRKEMAYIYHRGFTLAAHRLNDDDLIKAVNQFKAEMDRRKGEKPFPELPPQEETAATLDMEESREVDEGLYEAILGEKNCIYYLTKFKYFDWQPTNLKESWNWAAFLGGGVWALYRKMYPWFFAFLCMAALVAIFFIFGVYVLGFVAVLIFWIAFSIYANSLYHNGVKKTIAAAQLSITHETKLMEYLRYAGGVNTWVIWVSIFLPGAAILAIIIFYIAKR